MANVLVQVAVGGAVGASLRYLWVTSMDWMWGEMRDLPLGVATANIFGSFLAGAVAYSLMQRELGHLHPLLITGVLGGFTTFSAFSQEAVDLLKRGEPVQAGLYIGLTVTLSLLGLMAGLWLMRSLGT